MALLTFHPEFIAPQAQGESFGNFYMPSRGRKTCRGRDGRWYTVYDALNAGGTAAILRCRAWSFSTAWVIVEHWDVKVCDYDVTGGSDDGGGLIAAIAIDWNGTTERVLVLAGIESAQQMQLFSTQTAAPATFTAGDVFGVVATFQTAFCGFDLFGRRNGSDSIHVVYGNPNFAADNTVTTVVKHRTATTPTASWSAAADVIPAELAATDYQNGPAWTVASTRASNGGIFTAIGITKLGANRRLELAVWNGASWASNTVVSYSSGVGEDFYPTSIAVDLSGKLHVACIGWLTGAPQRIRLRYFRVTSGAAVEVNEQILELGFVDVVIPGPGVAQQRHMKQASIGCDHGDVPFIACELRADPSTFGITESSGVTPSSKWMQGSTLIFRRETGSWVGFLPTVRTNDVLPSDVHTVCMVHVPHDTSVIGKLGLPSYGSLWIERACHNPFFVAGDNSPVCLTPGHSWRAVRSADFDPGMQRQAASSVAFAGAGDSNDFVKVFASTVVHFAGVGKSAGSELSRSASTSLNFDGSDSDGGKFKAGAAALSFATLVALVVDALSKYKAATSLVLAGTATATRVLTRAASTFVHFDAGIFIPVHASTTVDFGGSLVLGGTVHLPASTSLHFAGAASTEPIEGCETAFEPDPPITDDEDDLLFVTITAPFGAPVKTITLRRPEFDDVYNRALQGETSIARDGTRQLLKREPFPVSWSVTFADLTRKQQIELEDFFRAFRGAQVLFRDHNNRRWKAVLLSDRVRFTSSGPERWATTLEFTGDLLTS